MRAPLGGIGLVNNQETAVQEDGKGPRDGPAAARARRKNSVSIKTALFVFIIVISNSFANVLLGHGMSHMPAFSLSFGYLFSLMTDISLVAGTVLMIVFTMAQLSLFSWADLTFVLPVTASGYIITDLLSRFLLNEPISTVRWVGIFILSLGVLLVAETPPHEKPGDEK